jgi:YD repeat-containing protein
MKISKNIRISARFGTIHRNNEGGHHEDFNKLAVPGFMPNDGEISPPFPVSAEIAAYIHDDLNRLTRAQYPDGSVIEYTYGAAGNRLARNVSVPLVNQPPPANQPPTANADPDQTPAVNGPVQVLSPNGGEIWKTKTVQTIQWHISSDLANVSKKVTIWFSKNGGKKWKKLKKVNVTADSFQWKPKRADRSTRARIQICLAPASKKATPVCDASNGDFTIQK